MKSLDYKTNYDKKNMAINNIDKIHIENNRNKINLILIEKKSSY